MGITLDRLVYDATDGGAEVGSHVLAGDDGTAIGHVSDALKVNFSNSSIAVTATDLDIRDLAFATDKVDASGSTLGANDGVDIGDVTINNAAGASAVNIQDGGNSITVDGSVTVSATDLDIRDLSHTQDSTKIGDGVEFLAINADGSINTKFAAPSNPKTSVVTVGATAVEIAATPLTDRTRLLVQNVGNKDIVIGESGSVTLANGIVIPGGASMELPYGDAANMFAISSAAGQELRVLELD